MLKSNSSVTLSRKLVTIAAAVSVVIAMTSAARPSLTPATAKATLSARTSVAQALPADANFQHPGMLYSRTDLDRMRSSVASHASPAWQEWNLLQANPLAKLNVTPKSDVIVYRNDAVHGYSGNSDLQTRASAALLDAIEWYVTGDQAYAQLAARLIDAWSSTLQSIQGHDQQLVASVYGYKLLNAAEILRYTYSGWTTAETDNFTTMMVNIFYPIVATYGRVNGEWANGNWDAADIVFAMCLGVWTDNKEIYDQAVDYYKNGAGNGSLPHYVQTPEGQPQEAGRDQTHTQFGLGMLSLAAQIGWLQRKADSSGADMYSYPNNSYLLLKGIEYTAKYNLGYSVPYTPEPGIGYTLSDLGTATYLPRKTISPLYRGRLRPIYDQVYHFYHDQIGLPESDLAYVRQIINEVPLERFDFDEPSYGGLLDGAPAAVPNTTERVSIITPYQSSVKGSYGATVVVPNAQDIVLASGAGVPKSNEFSMVYTGNTDEFAFRSLLTNLYLTVNSANGSVIANGTSIGPAQTFHTTQITNIDGNGDSWGLQSVSTGKYVAIDSYTGELFATASAPISGAGQFQEIPVPRA